MKLCLTAATRGTASALRPGSGAQRSMMRILSRWMWVSTKPAQTRRPAASKPGMSAGMLRPITTIPTGLDADVDRRIVRGTRQARVADNEVHASPFCRGRWRRGQRASRTDGRKGGRAVEVRGSGRRQKPPGWPTRKNWISRAQRAGEVSGGSIGWQSRPAA